MWLQKIKKRGWSIILLMGVGIILQSCLNGDEDAYDVYGYLSQDIQTIQTHLDASGIDAEKDSSGIFTHIGEFGDGYKTVFDADLIVHLNGYTLDGENFINTFNSSPVTVSLGQGNALSEVTTGLLVGLLGLVEGDSATIYVPSPYGFQDQAFENVPPNSILVYDVKIFEVKNLKEDYMIIDDIIEAKNWTSEIEPEYGIRYVIHKPGDENIEADDGDNISVHYQGELLDGTVFDSSIGGSPFTFNIGSGSLIVGFEAGVSMLNEQDSATILIPGVYAYGKNGSGTIPPNTSLLFGIEVLNVSKPGQ